MDLDDLIDEEPLQQEIDQNIYTQVKDNDGWGVYQQKDKKQNQLNADLAGVTSNEADEWGDLGETQKQIQQNEAIIQKFQKAQDDNADDGWGLQTPGPKLKSSKIDQIQNHVKIRKAEDNEEDEWGDIQQTSKPEQLFSYHNSTTGTEVVFMEHTAHKMSGEKCYPLYLGGCTLPQGQTQSSMKPMSCSSLRCFNCDKKVHRFINGSWHSSVDYMFVRNNNTNTNVLKTGVMFDPGFSAYACQCKYVNVNQIDSNMASDLKWMCGGH